MCMQFTGPAEGGYTNLPGDTGGETNHGISDARDGKLDGIISGVPTGFGGSINVPVRELSKEQARAIYRAEYYNAIGGDKLPLHIAVAAFDYAVNSGVARAAKAVQRVCGTAEDGKIGPATLAKVTGVDPRSAAATICDLRVQYLSTSTAPTIVKYRAALVARAKRCAAFCAKL